MGVLACLMLALWDTLNVAVLSEHPGRVILAILMIGLVCEWFYLRRREPTGIADRLGLMIGVLMAAFAHALG